MKHSCPNESVTNEVNIETPPSLSAKIYYMDTGRLSGLAAAAFERLKQGIDELPEDEREGFQARGFELLMTALDLCLGAEDWCELEDLMSEIDQQKST
jgi:hypothetical protein